MPPPGVPKLVDETAGDTDQEIGRSSIETVLE
jgi:hypothetical protein